MLALLVFLLALVGVFYPYNRGAPHTAVIIFYALTAGVAGYVSASLYRQMGGDNWVRQEGGLRRIGRSSWLGR